MYREHSDLPFIIMTAHSDMDSAVSAYESGAFEYLPKPFDVNEATELARRVLEHSKSLQKTTPAHEEDKEMTQTGIIGKSVAMQGVFRAIGRLSKSSISVLITGESGTGKELVLLRFMSIARDQVSHLLLLIRRRFLRSC